MRCAFYFPLLFVLLLMPLSSQAATTADQLIEMSLEDLMDMDIEVTAVSKREQSTFDSSAAVYAITSDDIARSGVTSLPEALRMAPGVQVARIGASEWSVGIRGLSGRFSRYLLVLVDGRSVYDPLFSGVNWDELNILLADIERIEVVRGASGTMWGANAVNGVINIVTKSALTEESSQLAVAGGDQGRGLMSFRARMELSDDSALRLSGKAQRRDGFESATGERQEGDARDERLSLAYALQGVVDDISVTADIYQMEGGPWWADTRSGPVTLEDGQAALLNEEDKRGYALQAKWRRQLSDRNQLNLRFSYDDIDRDASVYSWDTSNLDLDLEFHHSVDSHQLGFGVNSRFSSSDAGGEMGFPITLQPASNDIEVLSVFVHDTVTVLDDWQFTAGLRYEDNSEAGEHLQGTLRTLWRVDQDQRLWFALSRANSTPSRINTDNSAIGFLAAPAAVSGIAPVIAEVGNSGSSVDNAELDAIELGYRLALSKSFSLDLVLFKNSYQQLLTTELLAAELLVDTDTGLPYLVARSEFTDDGERDSEGGELSLSWLIHERWHLHYSASYIHYSIKEGVLLPGAEGLQVDAYNPSHQHSLQLSGRLSEPLSLNLWLRYVDEIDEINIDNYSVLDMKLDYRLASSWLLSAVAQNLGADHVELFREAFVADEFEVKSSFYVRAEYSF